MKYALTFFAPVLLFFLSGSRFVLAQFTEFTGSSGPSGSNNNSGKLPNPFKGDTPNNLYSFVLFVLDKIVIPIGSVVVVFFVIYAGYLFVTARGSDEKLTTAKHTFFGVVVGTAILLGSWAIATAIKGTLCQISGNGVPGLCQ